MKKFFQNLLSRMSFKPHPAGLMDNSNPRFLFVGISNFYNYLKYKRFLKKNFVATNPKLSHMITVKHVIGVAVYSLNYNGFKQIYEFVTTTENSNQVESLYNAIVQGFRYDTLRLLMQHEFDDEQARQIQYGFVNVFHQYDTLTLQEIKIYANGLYNADQMQILRQFLTNKKWILQDKPYYDLVFNPQLDSAHMVRIYTMINQNWKFETIRTKVALMRLENS